ncbi:MAG: hypothetical protein D6753_11330 [Planctomycetota bacterium]|nr:MAG: hypothetical protein D6753_11330 [Planctomycetota bacterium]
MAHLRSERAWRVRQAAMCLAAWVAFLSLPGTAAQAQSLGLSDGSLVAPAAYGALGGGAAQQHPARSVLTDDTSVVPAGFRHRQAAAFMAPPNQNPCAPGCDVTAYLSYEALWLRREGDDRFTLSRNTFLPDFDFELGGDFGGRYTVGWLQNCVDGWEVSYVGPYDWQRSATVSGAATLQSNFFPTGGYTASEVSAFNDADVHIQAYRAQLQTIELNRRWWEWDVVSTMIGIRFVDYEEDFLFSSVNGTVGNGLFLQSTDNEMIGIQAGIEAMYPVTLRLNAGVRAKGGVYANFADSQTFLNNAGTIVLNAGDSDVDVAGLIEVGYFANYSVTRSIRITGGYELWYMPGIATIPEQRSQVVSPSSGTTVFTDNEVVVHGGSVGVQVLF